MCYAKLGSFSVLLIGCVPYANYTGSDDVFLCNDYEEAKIAFKRINGHRNGVGLINDGALVQVFSLVTCAVEFLHKCGMSSSFILISSLVLYRSFYTEKSMLSTKSRRMVCTRLCAYGSTTRGPPMVLLLCTTA